VVSVSAALSGRTLECLVGVGRTSVGLGQDRVGRGRLLDARVDDAWMDRGVERASAPGGRPKTRADAWSTVGR
ncbi:hypothetical protein NJ76_11360, partial [Rhodococcus sp. IITR03]